LQLFLLRFINNVINGYLIFLTTKEKIMKLNVTGGNGGQRTPPQDKAAPKPQPKPAKK